MNPRHLEIGRGHTTAGLARNVVFVFAVGNRATSQASVHVVKTRPDFGLCMPVPVTGERFTVLPKSRPCGAT